MARQPGYIADIPDWFPTRKAAQVAAFFAVKAGGSINVLRAMKMIYLADRASLEEREFPITGDDFFSMRFGPVNSLTYRYVRGEAGSRADDWHAYIKPRQGNDIAVAVEIATWDDLDELSRGDVRLLEATWERFKDIQRFDLAEWTHKFCPEWSDPNGSAVPIEYASVFKQLQKDDPVALAETIQADRKLAQMMAG